jgi:cell division protein FtsB
LTFLGNFTLHSFLLTVLVGAGFLLVQRVQAREHDVAAKQAEVDQLQHELALVDAKNQQLKYNIRYLKTDDGVEKVAREKLDLVKPGEVTFQVIPPSETPTARRSTAPPRAAPPLHEPWYRQVIEAF